MSDSDHYFYFNYFFHASVKNDQDYIHECVKAFPWEKYFKSICYKVLAAFYATGIALKRPSTEQ